MNEQLQHCGTRAPTATKELLSRGNRGLLRKRAADRATAPRKLIENTAEPRNPSPDSDLSPIAMYQRSGVPRRHRECVVDDQASPREWVRKRNQLISMLGGGFLVTLVGDRGPGKTQLAQQVIAVTTKGHDRPALYARAMTFFLELRATFSREEQSEADVIARYCEPLLLVVDEMQDRGESAWEDRMLRHMLDVRYGDKKDTILIANLKPDAMQESLGASICDRLRETGGIIECTWPSFRDQSPAPVLPERQEVRT